MLLNITLLVLSFVSAMPVLASNMGFKLNFGIVNAVNRLLTGSGISIQANVVDDNVPSETLELSIDPVETQNSNMGFKLNIMSIPDNGILIEAPNGALYILTAGMEVIDGFEKETLTLTPVGGE